MLHARGLLFSSALLGLSCIAVAVPAATAHAGTTAGSAPADLTSSSLDVQGPYLSAVVVGATDEITGSLYIGGSPASAGMPIDVARTDVNTKDVAQFSTTTDGLGDFQSSDTLPALGSYKYVISYPGNATTEPASFSYYQVIVAPRQTTLGLGGPNIDIAGQPITLDGVLQPTGGLDDPPAGSVITVTRTMRGSTSTKVFTAATDADGDFTVKDTPPTPGDYTYSALYTSNNPYIASSGGDIGVTVMGALTYNGTIRLPKMGLCLDDRNDSARNGAIVQVWTCNGEENQQWQVYNDGTIRHGGLCLDATGHGTTNGTKVQLWACTGAANQKWDTKDFRIHYDNPAATGKVLDDTGSGGNGTQQEIWNNLGGKNQYWATS
jgi:hypothetical protein